MYEPQSKWQNTKVLVTGASGFIGSWLSATLLRLGAKVYGTCRHKVEPLSVYSILQLDKNITNYQIDITDKQQVYDMLNTVEPTVIFHLAAKAIVPAALRDPRRTLEVNIGGTLNILEACRYFQICDRLIICSTDHVFGDCHPDQLPDKGFDENSTITYAGPYETSKTSMELIVRSYYQTYSSDLPMIAITRTANAFGYGDTNERRIIPEFVRSAVNESYINLKYRKNGRQFIHITDAISGFLKTANSLSKKEIGLKMDEEKIETKKKLVPTYHFAIEKYENTEKPYLCMENLAMLIASEFNATVIEDRNITDYAPGENKVQAINCIYTRSLLNWKPQKLLNNAIKQLGTWYNEKKQLSFDSKKKLIEQDIIKITHSA